MEKTAYLQIKDLSKYFPGVQALKDVSFEAHQGEVLGLVGVNGAGKSTLMNILGGILQPDEGQIRIDGQVAAIKNPRMAEDSGIAFIQQEIQLFDTLRVFENVFIADLHKWRITSAVPFLRMQTLRSESKKFLDMLGCHIDVNTRVSKLAVGEQQMVQIARALSQGGKILLFDEPTSSLSPKEKERLFEVIGKLRASDLVVIYITHYLDEIFEICDKVVVLRDGQITRKGSVQEMSKKDLVYSMIGRDIEKLTAYPDRQPGRTILDVRNVSGEKYPKNASFTLREGEILGMWGLMGSGRTELFRTLLGFDPLREGEILYGEDGDVKPEKRRHFFKKVGYMTEERHFDGLFLHMPLWQNMTSVCLKNFASKFLRVLRSREESQVSREYMRKVNVKAVDENMQAYQLSGGNQQKVVIAKWFMKEPKVIFMDEPTKGVDVGAKAEIQHLIFERAKSGISFVIISSELEEIMYLCDRIIVLHNGELVSEVHRKDFSKDTLMQNIVMRES